MLSFKFTWLRHASLFVPLLVAGCGGSTQETVAFSTRTPAFYYAHAAAVKDGTVYSWGYNANGQLGAGGTSGNTRYLVDPVTVASNVPPLEGVTDVAVGGSHTLAFRNVSGATMWAWGNNGYGQVGTGDTNVQTSAMTVKREGGAELISVKGVAAGTDFSLAVRWDGTVWSWGSNNYGQLGDSGSERALAKPINGLSGIQQVAAGSYHGLALTADGKVFGWGRNDYGQLGVGSTGSPATETAPVAIAFPDGIEIIAIAAGGLNSYAIDSTNRVWAWGYNQFGQVGKPKLEDQERQPTPQRVPGLPGIVQISAGLDHCLALGADGTVWGWGYNGYGQIGRAEVPSVPDDKDYPTPQLITGIEGAVVKIRAVGHYSLAFTADSVWAWGSNAQGQLAQGEGDKKPSGIPRRVGGF
ncbi:hypothetical protein [Geobacter sp. DSM 9736]|uniref:RCC1 domain-containing protein n=1 Tax=Geobacter sp. DSM 9736 TaxID=1277350 RepID=UPI000B500B00|nr:hypothetical protein [Geobacter sp. DSM 9736]SNB45002.1 Alpha-tubulin suppressor [Geobacter sp. DSM 9736]